MKLEQAITHALNGNAVLFTGSGFSKGATNLQGRNFITGRELAAMLRQEIGLDEEINLGLSAEIFEDRKGIDRLLEVLRDQFTVKDISDHHRTVGSVNWKRVYTTNYDNVLETAAVANSRKLIPVTLAEDPTQFSGKDDLCVHINGYIDRLTRQSLFDSFKLTDTSYLTESFRKSDWAYVFRSDLRQSQAIFFVGYSLFDVDITRILFEEPALAGKCFFITAPNPSPATTFALEKYGRVVSEGVESFAQYLEERKRTWNPARYEPVYVGFEEIQIPKGIPQIKDQDIFNLFLYGRERRDLIHESLQRPDQVKYYVRRSKLDSILASIESGEKTFVVTSSLGNGKTLICLGLAYTAVTKGYKVFFSKGSAEYLEKEISSICQIEEPVLVIIENYHRYLDKIRQLQLSRPATLILVLSSRTEANDIYYEDLERELRGVSPEVLDVDQIDRDAALQITDLFDHYGLWGKLAARSHRSKLQFIHRMDDSLQRLLLELLKSPDIATRFKELLESLNEITGTTEVIVVACVLTHLDYPPRLSILSELLETNAAREIRFRKDPRVREIVDLREDTLGARSAIFARFILNSIPDSNLVIDTIIRIANRANELARFDTMYRYLFRDLLRFANLQAILPEQQRRPAIINFYETLKNLSSTKRHPHFWLQYAIARLSFPDLDEAKIYFDTSYSLAASMSHYDTTQIDNHYARYLLERAKRETNTNVAFEQYEEANGLLRKQILRPNRHYPYRVAIGYYEFFLSHFDRLDSEQKESFRASCRHILARIEKLQPWIRTHPNVQECEEKFQEIVG